MADLLGLSNSPLFLNQYYSASTQSKQLLLVLTSWSTTEYHQRIHGSGLHSWQSVDQPEYNNGPRTEPCGTPVVIGNDPPTRTVKDRPVRYEAIHWQLLSVTPNSSPKHWIKISCETASNTADMSRLIGVTVWRLLILSTILSRTLHRAVSVESPLR